MCGRYYLSEDAEAELEEIVKQLDREIRGFHVSGDITPASMAPVLSSRSASLHMDLWQWGLPILSKNKLLINTRSETVTKNPQFSTSFHAHRCVIPASGFYEWDTSRNKFTFHDPDAPLLFMGGIAQDFEAQTRFSILTTAANSSMEPVHPRMPLLMTADQIIPFLEDELYAIDLLSQIPGTLSRETSFEQMRLDFL